ncbi:hypothetical protein L228DRAFT_250264 [Xylona heveae TC161]|uniref:DUF2470 domain-containing protein n=1 Tax=Xylona heveae (strain CBS 132557 / TC161) TaxID=1328760 RepID=A0A165A1V7_XYLHT|nr:hypothetical protein L228DRAFT_250264 [Xylona heveae TC161]KZF19837.1 hypothetical protein L228DRAFT_250264 [Xylona heveae TC161]
MSAPGPSEAQIKQRIISHMNSGHQDSLIKYLKFYSHLSSFAARNARLTDISFSGMDITSNGKIYVVEISPPLKSWGEARERLVKMDKDATIGLGLSDVTVKEYRRPKGFHAVIFTVCFATYVAFSRRSNFIPGSLLYDLFLQGFPAFGKWLYTIQPLLIVTMVAIHVFEVTWLARTRLRVHNVPVTSKLWWIWMASCFIEGFGSFQRFDDIVYETRKAKESQKH